MYIFTGLQNIDWIPKRDPEPTAAFDIIQPVLQYPSDWNEGWSVKSWYVTVDEGAIYSSELLVASGESVFGNMTRAGATSWYIGTTVPSGKTTAVTVNRPRLALQPWAYNTLETYGVDSCSQLPTDSSRFVDLQLFDEKGQKFNPTWVVTPKAPVEAKCKAAIHVGSPSAVTVTFQ